MRLYFSNRASSTSTPGKRTFDVAINGTTVLDHYDVVASAGNATGTMQAFTTTSNGAVTINFTHEVNNPMIDGIELVDVSPDAPVAGAADTLTERAYSGSIVGASTTIPADGTFWSQVRGAFMAGNKLFYGYTDGNMYVRTFDGTNLGPATMVDPYEDPAWATVDTGSGQTFIGAKPTLYGSELQSVTGMFFAGGRLYYTLYGQPNLYSRTFSPDSGIVGPDEKQTGTVNLSNASGMFLSGGTLYYANRLDGTLHAVAFSTVAVGPAIFNPGTTDPTTDVVVSGPAIDGTDWRAHGLFLYGSPAHPTASFQTACTNLACSTDATASTGSSALTYAWDFGDGTTSTGVTAAHTYAAAGNYTQTLTVTDTFGQVASTTRQVSAILGPLPTASFTASCTLLACSFDASASTGPSGGIAGYTWDFGDGTGSVGPSTSPTASHTYALSGAHTVSLTVTDGLGQTATQAQSLTASAIAFVGSAQVAGKTATETVTVPSAVTAGNGLVLVATTTGTTSPTAPAGWTLVGTRTAGTVLVTSVWSKVAAADAGTPVTVTIPGALAASVQLLAYSGTSATAPVLVAGSAGNAVNATAETTPVVTVAAPGSVAVSLWQAKTSALTTWTAPAGQLVRSTSIGTGGGRIAALAADSGTAVPDRQLRWPGRDG